MLRNGKKKIKLLQLILKSVLLHYISALVVIKINIFFILFLLFPYVLVRLICQINRCSSLLSKLCPHTEVSSFHPGRSSYIKWCHCSYKSKSFPAVVSALLFQLAILFTFSDEKRLKTYVLQSLLQFLKRYGTFRQCWVVLRMRQLKRDV